MSGYVNDYRDLLKIASYSFNELLENTSASNFFKNLSSKFYYKYLGRYYYNKSLSNEYENKIIVVPKSGYITQRLVYLNDDLIGGTRVGTQAINITEQDGSIQLRNSGAVGFCPLGRFFDSLCYAFGIKVDKTKIDIYSLCDSVLQNFEFVYNRETGLHIPINSANFNNVHVLYIVEDEKTYFDEDLVQAFANVMYENWLIPEVYYNTTITGSGTSIYVDVTDSTIKGLNAQAVISMYQEAMKESVVEGSIINTGYILKAFSYFHEKFPDSIPIYCTIGATNELIYMDRVYIYGAPMDELISEFGASIRWTDYLQRNNVLSNYKLYQSYLSSYRLNQVLYFTPNDSSGERVSYLEEQQSAIVSGISLTKANFFYFGALECDVTENYKDGITIIDGAKIPSGQNTLSTDYPNWFSRLKNIVGTAVETAGETLRNVFKVIEFVPLTLIGEKPTEPDNPDVPLLQDTTQTGVVLSPTVIGTLPEYTVKYLTPLPDTDTPISPTSPYYPDNPYYPSDTPIGDPTVDPTTPPVIGGVTPPVPDNPIVNASNGLFTVYNPTMEQLNQLGGYLWGEDIVGILQSIFQNPIDGVISLHILYATPETGDEVPIKVGYLTSTVSAKKVVEQYINIDCGTVNIPEYYGNVLDYAPFTKAHIYLPFIGIREINVNEIMGGQVNVNYKIDVLTGSVYASISVFHNAISQVLYVFEGNGGVQLPLTGGNMSRILSGVVSGIAFGALTGGAVGAVAGATGGLLKGASVSKSGSVSSNAGAMGIKKPYIMITHSQAYMANNYNTQYGYPSNLTTQLSACKGYTRVKEVHVENILVATQEEKDMIQTLLREGVIIE